MKKQKFSLSVTLTLVCVLCIAIVLLWAQAIPELSPNEYHFGEVEIGNSMTVTITLSNIGIEDLIATAATFQQGSSPDFSIISGPTLPITLKELEEVEFELQYTPSSIGPASAVFLVHTNEVSEDCRLDGTGVSSEIPPEEQIDNTITFFDESVEDESLVGTGEGESAEKRLTALRNMLLKAQQLIDAGDYDAACDQLYSVYLKCDGEPKPPDFVEGESRDDLAAMIWELMQDLGCEQCLAKRYAPEPENETITLPTEYVLEQNQPNPFNPTTTISYTVATNSHVKLTVYNTLGQVVAVLVNGFQSQGSHHAKLDLANQPSGLYIYRLEANGFQATKKMFLLK